MPHETPAALPAFSQWEKVRMAARKINPFRAGSMMILLGFAMTFFVLVLALAYVIA